MNYYKDKKTDEIYVYDDEQLAQVARITELESLINLKEPIFIEANQQLQLSAYELDNAKAQLDLAIENESGEDIIAEYEVTIELLTKIHDEKQQAFNEIDSECQAIKDEYHSILPIFFDIREKLKVMKKMSDKEVDAYLSPPISKEQLIAEADQRKQLLLAEANNVIAPLQDAVDLGMATEAETAALQEWKKYRVLLNRVDTSTAPNIDWPEKPEKP